MKTLATTLLATCLLGFAAQAVTVQTAELPPGNPYLSLAPGAASNTQWRNGNPQSDLSRRDLGQSFTYNSDVTLQSLTLRLSSLREDAPGSEFTLAIYAFEDKESFTPAGPALYSSGGELPASMTAGEYITFTLDTPLALEAGKYYGFVLTFPDWARYRLVNFHSQNGAGVANYGTMIYYQYDEASSGYTWQKAGNAMEMYAVAVPEPSTVGLSVGVILSLAAGKLVMGRRGRKLPPTP